MREGLWAPPNRALTAGLMLAITFVAAEALAVVTVMPVVARELGGLWLYGWVFTAFMLGSIIGIVTAGREADRRGPAIPFLAGLLLFSAGLAVAGLAPSIWSWWLAGRCRASAAARCPRWRTPRSAAACPPAAGPDDGAAVHRLGGAGAGRAGPGAEVAHLFGWRWVFLGLLPLVAIAGVIAVPSLAGSARRAPGIPGSTG